jgi:hypothetical protein
VWPNIFSEFLQVVYGRVMCECGMCIFGSLSEGFI